MTHNVYVIGRTAAEAEEFIRKQNDSRAWPDCTEFVTVTRPEQLLGLRHPTVVTLEGFVQRRDSDQMANLILNSGGPWLHY